MTQKRITVAVSPSIYGALVLQAKAEGVSVADIVRRILDRNLY